jgi:hypothetical protein
MNRSGPPLISPWEKGHRSVTSILPGSASERLRRARTLDDPVSRNRPGRGSRSTGTLIARMTVNEIRYHDHPRILPYEQQQRSPGWAVHGHLDGPYVVI